MSKRAESLLRCDLRVARRLNEEKAAVYARILNISFSLSRELFPEVC